MLADTSCTGAPRREHHHHRLAGDAGENWHQDKDDTEGTYSVTASPS
jgi:hypothetical protein